MAPPFAHFRNVSDRDKSKAVQKLITVSTPDYDFFVMVTLSVLMAALGLWINSVAIVIGSMLIAQTAIQKEEQRVELEHERAEYTEKGGENHGREI